MAKIIRFNPSIEDGLNKEEVKQRYKNNLVNYDTNVKTKSIKDIVLDNV